MCLDKRQTNAFIEVWCERTIMCKSLSWTMRRNILLARQKLRDGIEMTFAWTHEICLRSAVCQKVKSLCKIIWNTLKGNKRKQQCYARKSVTKTLTVGLLRDCFLPINGPFMINDFCSSTNIRLCVSSRLCLNRNKFREDFCVLKKIRRVTLTVD